MASKHLFVIDPIESLNLALDSSLRMMRALEKQGATCYGVEMRDLSWDSRQDVASASCRKISFPGSPTAPTVGDKDLLFLDKFSAIHMRKDPPFDMAYVAATWLLDRAGPNTKIYNEPAALRTFNEKVAILHFPEHIRPAIVSADPKTLLAFAEEVEEKDIIVKPLDLFGGRGIERLKIAEMGSKKAFEELERLTAHGAETKIVQAFDPRVFEGEVRAFTTCGKAIGWCLKKPKGGNFLANTRTGATLEPYTPPPEVLNTVETVAKKLIPYGIKVVGFDLIGGFVSEINITSPRMLIAEGDDEAHYDQFADLILQDLQK